MMNEKDISLSTSSQEDLDILKKYLPYNYLKLIKKAIETQCSDRLIQYILRGQKVDNYGVLDAALVIAKAEKKKQEALAKKLAKLSK